MRIRIVREKAREAYDRQADNNRGVGRRGERSMAGRAAEIQIADIHALPVMPTATDLQDGDGLAYFMVGYSTIGGPDPIRAG